MSPIETRETTIKRLPQRRRGRRYRYDVVIYKPVEGQHHGVYDARLHIGQEMGYTRTWLGAALAMARKVTTRVVLDDHRA